MRDPITILETIGADAALMGAGAAQLSELLEGPDLRRSCARRLSRAICQLCAHCCTLPTSSAV